MNFCLPPDITKRFLQGLKNGEIDPGKMAQMSSEERRAYLSDFVGERSSKAVNTLFESKLLLKNQQQGMITWAKAVSGLSEATRTDMISKINKLDRVLNETDQRAFLQDLAEKRLGTKLTVEEANTIAKMAREVQEKKIAITDEQSRLDYGRAKVKLGNYIADLKNETNKQTFGEKLKDPVKIISEVAGTAKSLKASLDDSAIFRQGWKTLVTHPNIWRKNALESFSNLAKSLGGKKVLDEVNADIVSRPNYDLMKKAKLAVGSIEEDYPSQLPAKIPGFSRVYKASEETFTAFVHKTRADVFDKYIEIAKNSDVDLDKEQIESIGKLVNSLTGRGDLGALEPSANVINNIFFSPRALKSHIDTLLQPITGAGGSDFVRKQAAINLVKIITATAGILTVANVVKPGSAQLDPRSSDFGKIKIGDTRFDVTGGMASLATLAARLATLSTKSTVTEKVTGLNSGKFGSQTGTDVVYSFLENKLSPMSSVVKDLLKGQDFNGNKPSVAGEASNLLTPLPITNYLELKNDPKSADNFVAILADSLGIATNTYSPKKKGVPKAR